MLKQALFINGVYESVLKEILAVQENLPEHIMYLQPYSSQAIKELQKNPPNVDSPMRLYISLTTDLSHVHYIAEIVAWDDKRELFGKKREVIENLIDLLQKNEDGLYNAAQGGDGESVNLLSIRRLQKLDVPFNVSMLTKLSGGPLSEKRTTSGGWSYVERIN